MSTVIRMRALSVSTSEFWRANENGEKPQLTTVGLNVVDTQDKEDPNFVYSNLSPGSYLNLSTINEAVGAEFEKGAEYEIVIRKVKEAPAVVS
jgi:hypothetical protein